MITYGAFSDYAISSLVGSPWVKVELLSDAAFPTWIAAPPRGSQ